MGRLDGKVAIITGGAAGMGEATVRRFVQEGAQTIITDVQTEAGQALAAATGALFIHHDVSDEAAWRRVMATVESRFGRLDVVFNNAGIYDVGTIEELDMAKWNRLIGVNQTGVMLGCHFGIELMKKNPGGSSGSLINTASSSAFMGIPIAVAYTATKGAVRLMTKAIAGYCAKEGLGIRCNTLVPGAIRTPMINASIGGNPEIELAANRMSPMGRMGTCEEIAAMALFLASDESSFCTGSEFLVEGGTLSTHPGF